MPDIVLIKSPKYHLHRAEPLEEQKVEHDVSLDLCDTISNSIGALFAEFGVGHAIETITLLCWPDQRLASISADVAGLQRVSAGFLARETLATHTIRGVTHQLDVVIHDASEGI